MPEDPTRLDDVFTAALAESSPSARAQFLDHACQDDPELRERVDALLAAHAAAGDFLNVALPSPTTPFVPVSERPGEMIGPYKLLQQIGEGGMGVVFMAEQVQPVRRKVALKIIRPGMDSRQVTARFEAERQALALMDHPNIARVLDAGTTDSARPYFVMELVNGVPITEYCDAQHLTPRDRLDLFVPVCHAVQHAHQKGVIHRDLKPSNILVTLVDGRPMAKIIDFGVAKATGDRLTEASLWTEFGAVVGTLEYMSPEQAVLSNNDVDTRADVYSLGVILYELLTGLRPIDAQRLKEAGLVEMLRVIQEEEPSKPSTRLSTDKQIASLAALRHTDPKRLVSLLRGDLDWVVMKCLEKSRNRRYETASALARDVERYLADEPVEARAPTALYRLQKLVRRRRGAVVAASLALLSLIIGLVGASIGLMRAERARQAEARQRVAAESAEMQTLAEFRAATDDALRLLIGSKPDLGPQERKYLENTLHRWQEFAARLGDDVRSQMMRAEAHERVAKLWDQLGRQTDALKAYHVARDIRQGIRQEDSHNADNGYALAKLHILLSYFAVDRGDADDASSNAAASDELIRQLRKESADGAKHTEILAKQEQLAAQIDIFHGRYDEALIHIQRALDAMTSLVAANAASVDFRASMCVLLQNKAAALLELAKYDEAYAIGEERGQRIDALIKDFPDHPDFTLEAANNFQSMSLAKQRQRDFAGAADLSRRSIEIGQKLVEQFPAIPNYQERVAQYHLSLASSLRQLQDMSAAKASMERAVAIRRRLADQFPTNFVHRRQLVEARILYAELLYSTRQFDEAKAELRSSLEAIEALRAEAPQMVVLRKSALEAHEYLAMVSHRQGESKDAEAEHLQVIAICDEMIAEFPAEIGFKYTKAQHLRYLSELYPIDLRPREGPSEAARVALESAVQTLEPIAAARPDIVILDYELGEIYCQLAMQELLVNHPVEAVELYDKGIDRLVAKYNAMRDPEVAAALVNSYLQRATAETWLNKPELAQQDWARAAEYSPSGLEHDVRFYPLYVLMHARRYEEAIAGFEKLLDDADWSAENWYAFASALARASAQNEDRRQQYLDRAMSFLQKSVAAGFDDLERFTTDRSLDYLRDRNDFRALVKSLAESRAKPSPAADELNTPSP